MIGFYRDVLGLRVTKQATIRGPWIEAVTGLADVEADVAFLESPTGPAIELLYYRTPRGSRPGRTGPVPTRRVFVTSRFGCKTSRPWWRP